MSGQEEKLEAAQRALKKAKDQILNAEQALKEARDAVKPQVSDITGFPENPIKDDDTSKG